MNVILLITILVTFDNGVVSHEYREIKGLPSLEVCEFIAKEAVNEALKRELPNMEVNTFCFTRGEL